MVKIAKELQPSARGEYEITDVNKHYLSARNLSVHVFDRREAWLDTGTFDSLYDASKFVIVVEKRQGYKIGYIEEIDYRKGFITKDQLLQFSKEIEKSEYGVYLKRVVG